MRHLRSSPASGSDSSKSRSRMERSSVSFTTTTLVGCTDGSAKRRGAVPTVSVPDMKTETAALIIAAISLLFAGLSLGWQVAQWLLSAARPKAQLMHGVLDAGGAYVGPVGRGGKRMDVQQFRRQGFTG